VVEVEVVLAAGAAPNRGFGASAGFGAEGAAAPNSPVVAGAGAAGVVELELEG